MTNLTDQTEVNALTNRDWTIETLEIGARSLGHDPESRLLGLFDVLGDVINRADREARAFVASLVGNERSAELMTAITRLAAATGPRDVEGLAQSIRLLVAGSAAAALVGDLDSARRGRALARNLMESRRVSSAVQGLVSPVPHECPSDHDLNSYLDRGF